MRVVEIGRRNSGGMGGVRMVLITKRRRGRYGKEKDRREKIYNAKVEGSNPSEI